MQKPFSKNKEERFFEKHLDNRVANNILSTFQKKEDIKMDEQIKIKILKYFDHGLQKPFYKNKEERFSKPFWIIGYQITFSPLLKKKKI